SRVQKDEKSPAVFLCKTHRNEKNDRRSLPHYKITHLRRGSLEQYPLSYPFPELFFSDCIAIARVVA
ncbi:MAG: hypothetical protein ACLQGT_07510, partial [Terracidiphilus sp.]